MWDATPGHATPGAMTPGRETPGATATPSASTRKNRWDETPRTERGEVVCVLVLFPLYMQYSDAVLVKEWY